MVIDLVRLILFPTIMAFAASSDLLTMTISNRVSMALVGGFFALALMSGMAPMEVLSHAGAGAVVQVPTQCWLSGISSLPISRGVMGVGKSYDRRHVLATESATVGHPAIMN